MRLFNTLSAAAIAATVTVFALPALAQESDALTTTDEVRAEISDAMEAIAAFSAQERDQAIAAAREAMSSLDAEIDRRERAMRENWAEMSADAREIAEARLRDLREARNRLGERFGALELGSESAWEELKTGFSDSWAAFSESWSAADEDSTAN